MAPESWAGRYPGIVVDRPGLPALLSLGRIHRWLRHAGAEPVAGLHSLAELPARLNDATRPILLAVAGTWFSSPAPLPPFPNEGPWIAVGAWRGATAEAQAWKRALARCGGDLTRLRWWQRVPPAPPALLLSPLVAQQWAQAPTLASWSLHWRRLWKSGLRLVHVPELDAHHAPFARALQVVTSIQIGGAERVALDLHAVLPELGVASQVITLGRPTRAAYPAPPGLIDLSTTPHDPAQRAEAIFQAAIHFGADVVHAHLIRATEARAIRTTGLPLLLHLHNLPRGWPPDYSSLQPADVSLLIACSQAVAAAAREALPSLPVRTIWNGIASFRQPRSPRASDRPWTALTLANPRAQKRLELIPAIAVATARALAPRRVRFIIAGANQPYSDDSAAALATLEQAIIEHRAEHLIDRPGLVSDPHSLLAQTDVLLSVSAYEGLSLAHLEALAAGVPVVATAAGGTGELAAQSAAVSLLPLDAPPTAFVEAFRRLPITPVQLPPSFTRHAMAQRAQRFYLSAIETPSFPVQPRRGLWLITNNFSTGGAQSSARRLLQELHRRGIKVRAAVIQEEPDTPTPGRRALQASGIPVMAIPPMEREQGDSALHTLRRHLQSDPSEAVFFWNLITSLKVSLADLLPAERFFDISPGEMYFDSLAKFFAKLPAGFPYRSPAEYGARLAGAVVKFHGEAALANRTLQCPVRVIPNGIPLSSRPVAAPSDRLVLGTAVRLSPDKKLTDLLDAVRLAAPQLPPFVLRIAGGPERDHPGYMKLLFARAKGLPVEWIGEIQEVTPFLYSLDLFLMISEPAGCPNATLEAMAAGLPVIATDHGGAREQVLDGLNGRLVPRGDARAFADALLALAHDPALRQRLGAAAREHMTRHFALTTMADRYQELITGEPASPASTERADDADGLTAVRPSPHPSRP